MGFKLGVLLIHGMGDQSADFADGMIGELTKRVRRAGGDDRHICFQKIWWAPILAQKEADLIRRMSDSLDWMSLRRFVIRSLADAIAYQASYRRISAHQISVYKQVHQEIGRSVRSLRKRLRSGKPKEAPEAPLVIIGHSLGCHMISNYIWDVRHKSASSKPKNAFDRMETISAVITMGCNIPLFALAFERLEPIEFPTPGIRNVFPAETDPEELRQVTQWWNFYDPDDVLGYPLRSLDPLYAQAVDRDIAVNVGGLFTSWNPASHMAYWTDNDVTVPVAELLSQTLALLP